MGQKGGSADPSGMYASIASAQAAQQAYQLGEQQLQWTQQVWNQEQPTINAITSADVSGMQQEQQFAQQQEALYNQTYEPMMQNYAQQAQQWASPAQQQLNAGQAEANVSEAGQQGLSAAQQQLESYGVNPASGKYAGLDIGARTQTAAAAAGAGTQAIQQTKLQGLGLEQNAIAQGMGVGNLSEGLSSGAVNAGGAGAGASQSNLATGSQAMTAPATYYNTGAANMNVYANAVNGYNQSQLGYAQVGAMQGMGMGALAGGLLGMLEKGGPINFQDGGPAPAGNPGNVTATPGVTASSPTAIPPDGTPGGYIAEHTSPSRGHDVDDVPARLTAGEFVIPKDVVAWNGLKYYYGDIDKARQAKQVSQQRTDIGGERGRAAPAIPTFTSSRPMPPANTNSAIPHARAV